MMTCRHVKRAALARGDKQTGSMKSEPAHALVYESFVCQNPPGMTVIWEGNGLGKLKCTGT